MASEDTIHSFYVPAFRLKRDVLPGRVATMWFEATRKGRYHLFCAEYCGTKHSGMIGWLEVMDPVDFQAWLAGGTGSESLASTGAKLFAQHACNTCHRPDSLARGPNLEGLFGQTVRLQDGRTIVADESYIRESIVMPNAKTVMGFQPIMPTFQGLISEEGLLQLVAYVKSLSKAAPSPGGIAPPVKDSAPEREIPRAR
jgi:cytochrome c oxidase subunit 2